MPLRAFSSGIVTRLSTSSVDRPGASVWISTIGGANSGKTSSGACAQRAVADDEQHDAQRRAARRAGGWKWRRARRAWPYFAEAGFGAEQFGGTGGDDLGLRRRPAGEDGHVTADVAKDDTLPHVDPLARFDVDPSAAKNVVDHGGPGDDETVGFGFQRQGNADALVGAKRCRGIFQRVEQISGACDGIWLKGGREWETRRFPQDWRELSDQKSSPATERQSRTSRPRTRAPGPRPG